MLNYNLSHIILHNYFSRMNKTVLICGVILATFCILIKAQEDTEESSFLDKLCEKCAYCKTDPNCDGCSKCSECTSRSQVSVSF